MTEAEIAALYRGRRYLVVAELAVGLAMPAWGQDIDAGVAAHERGRGGRWRIGKDLV